MNDTYRVEESTISDKLYWTKGVDQGKELERDRIINLLQADICFDFTVDCCDGWCAAYDGAIKLINNSKIQKLDKFIIHKNTETDIHKNMDSHNPS
jgi:hypothetical protein